MTGRNPLSLCEGEGAGGETGKNLDFPAAVGYNPHKEVIKLLPWILCALLAAVCLALAAKIISINLGVKNICRELSELISEDTNRLITVSTGDPTVRLLARELDRHLRELKRLRRQYINGDRELKEAVTNISHDLRTPLTAICGYLELIRSEHTGPAVKRYLGYIENRAEALKKLTDELFSYSVILSTAEDLTLEPVDAAAVLEESIAGLYGAFVKRGIEPDISLPEEKVMKILNRDALSRVYGNILTNALKYSDGDLKIVMDGSGRAEFSNRASNLSGVDAGRLFDRFFSVEAARNSTGLGLAISKTLVEKMGGSITARTDGDVLTVTVGWEE